MGLRKWLSGLINIDLRKRVRCDLSAEDTRRIEMCRPTAETHLGDGSDEVVVRLALRLHGRLLRQDLPTMYSKAADGTYIKRTILADRAVAPFGDEVVGQLQLAVGRKSLKRIREMGQETEQDEAGVIRSALATLARAASGNPGTLYARNVEGQYVEVGLIDMALHAVRK